MTTRIDPALSPAGRLPAPGRPDAGAGAQERDAGTVGGQVERLFLSMLLKELKKGLPGGRILPGGGACGAFEAFLDHHLADAMAERGVGIGEAFARCLSRDAGARTGEEKGSADIYAAYF